MTTPMRKPPQPITSAATVLRTLRAAGNSLAEADYSAGDDEFPMPDEPSPEPEPDPAANTAIDHATSQLTALASMLRYWARLEPQIRNAVTACLRHPDQSTRLATTGLAQPVSDALHQLADFFDTLGVDDLTDRLMDLAIELDPLSTPDTAPEE